MRYLIFVILLVFPLQAFAAACLETIISPVACNPLTQSGITWTFDTDYVVGQFVNGDYWVVGPVTINSVTPTFDSTWGHNGMESNPDPDYKQGYDYNTYGGGYDSSLNLTLPYDAVAGESLVKADSVLDSGERLTEETCRGNCLSTVSILTVLATQPDPTTFRPPWTGTTKPLFSTDDLETDLLPSLASVGSPPTIQSIVDRFKPTQFNDELGNTGRALRPQDNMNDYQPQNTTDYNEAILRVMLNDSLSTKMPAIIQLVQYGIDTGYLMLNGHNFPPGGGHQPGHRLVAAFAAIMLDITALKTELTTATDLHEDWYIYSGVYGQGLWGEPSTELGYWQYIMGLGGSRTQEDPYGYIDGGECGAAYQILTVGAHVGERIATVLIPELQDAWNSTEYDEFADYVDRWHDEGIDAAPDPCAPYDGNNSNYGVTYGPDTNDSGCVLDPDLASYTDATTFTCDTGADCGRYPEKDGTNVNGGTYTSSFVDAMWTAYYDYEATEQQISFGQTGTLNFNQTGTVNFNQ